MTRKEKWKKHYQDAKKFHEKYGHLCVPRDDKELYYWLNNQRKAKKGTSNGVITKDEIKMLDDLDMNWDPDEATWDEYYALAEQYYKEHGDLDIQRNYVVNGKHLGQWINVQRNAKKGIDNRTLSPERIQKLDKIKMIWEKKKRTPFTQMPISEKNTIYYQKKLLIKLNRVLNDLNQEKEFLNINDIKEIEKEFVKILK